MKYASATATQNSVIRPPRGRQQPARVRKIQDKRPDRAWDSLEDDVPEPSESWSLSDFSDILPRNFS